MWYKSSVNKPIFLYFCWSFPTVKVRHFNQQKPRSLPVAGWMLMKSESCSSQLKLAVALLLDRVGAGIQAIQPTKNGGRN